MTNTTFHQKAIEALQSWAPYNGVIDTHPEILSILDDPKLDNKEIPNLISEIRLAHILNKIGYPLGDIKNIFSNNTVNCQKIGGPDFYIHSQNTFIEVVSPQAEGDRFYQQVTQTLPDGVQLSTVQFDANNFQNIMAHITSKIREKNEQIKRFKEKIHLAKNQGLLKLSPDNAKYIIAISIAGLDPRGGMLVHNDEYFPLFISCILPMSNFPTFRISKDNDHPPTRVLEKQSTFSSRGTEINKITVWTESDNIDAVIFFNPYVGSSMEYVNTTAQIWGVLSPFTTMTEEELRNIFTPQKDQCFKCEFITYEIKFNVSIKK